MKASVIFFLPWIGISEWEIWRKDKIWVWKRVIITTMMTFRSSSLILDQTTHIWGICSKLKLRDICLNIWRDEVNILHWLSTKWSLKIKTNYASDFGKLKSQKKRLRQHFILLKPQKWVTAKINSFTIIRLFKHKQFVNCVRTTNIIVNVLWNYKEFSAYTNSSWKFW